MWHEKEERLERLAQQPQASRWAGTHFACFTGTKVQILTVEVRSFFLPRMSGGKHFSVSPQCGNSCLCVGGDGSVLLVLYLLYWYKGTNLVTAEAPCCRSQGAAGCAHSPAAQFTCFTGTRVQILTLEVPHSSRCTMLCTQTCRRRRQFARRAQVA